MAALSKSKKMSRQFSGQFKKIISKPSKKMHVVTLNPSVSPVCSVVFPYIAA